MGSGGSALGSSKSLRKTEGLQDNPGTGRRQRDFLCRPFSARYLGSAAVPVTVNSISDLFSVSCGWAPPTLSLYLPGRIERLPWSSTLDNDRGSISSATSRLVPPEMFSRLNATSE